MAKGQVWDFECPQYVDFERELDKSATDEVFFESTFNKEKRKVCVNLKIQIGRRYVDEKRHGKQIMKEDCKDTSPENGSLCKTPGIAAKTTDMVPYPDRVANQSKVKGLTESDENRLLDKMSAALSVLENTPKVKKSATRGKLFSERNLKGLASNLTKSAIKPNTIPALPRASRRRSKSLNHLNKIVCGATNKTKGSRLPRSSSLNDLRVYRKSKYPVTPMCLKRTVLKAKEKIKTTEERELEEIAKLQKQLKQHLRQNEMTMKKLKLKPRQAVVPKPDQGHAAVPKCDGLKDTTGSNVVVEKSSMAEKEPRRRNIRMLNHTDVKRIVAKLDNIINKESSPTKQMNNTIYCRKSNLSVSSIDSNVNTSTTQKTKKSSQRPADHSGLIFLPSIKSNSVVKPFIFEAKSKEAKPQIAGAKQKEKPVLSLKENDKENIPCMRSESAVKKTKEMKNAKCDNKLRDKITKKSAATPLRGVPFAENFTRN